MATTMNMWKDKIVLYWDRRLLPQEEDRILYKEKTELKELLEKEKDPKRRKALHIAISDDVILAKHYSAMTKELLPHIHGYAKFNKKFGAFLLSLSKQNLQRIHAQFGAIPIKSGYGSVQQLKDQLSAFKKMADLSLEIRRAQGNALLPYEDGIVYKCKPFGFYQRVGVTLLTKIRRMPLFADCGMGKGFQVLTSTEHQIKTGILQKRKTLVCGKLNTLYSGWLDDAKKFTDLKVVCLWLSTSYKRKEKMRALLNEDADIFLINHEGIHGIKEELVAMKFDKVVIDESTVLKSFHSERKGASGGKFGQAIMEIAQHAEWRVIMSGTPAPNGVQDLWGQFKFLDPEGFMLERNFNDFKQLYMEEKVFGKASDRFAPRTWVQRPGVNAPVRDAINQLAYRVKIRDHIESLPPLTIIKRVVPMTPAQESHYKGLAKEFCTKIDDTEITATISLALISRFRQITGGFLYDMDKQAHEIRHGDPNSEEGLQFDEGNPKVDILDSLLLDKIPRDEKVVIFAQYEYEITMILERYKDLGLVSVYGGNNSKTNMDNIAKFINDPSVHGIVMHPKSSAHGITLVVARYMIFYSVSFSSEEDYQCIKRIERANQLKAMFVYYLLCEESICTVMFDILQQKHANQEMLLDQGGGISEEQLIVARFSQHLKDKYPKLIRKEK